MRPQQIVADRFEVSECIGSGACGAVFRAWDRVLEREVAIKQLDRALDERVMSTSRAAARLNHPAIVPLFEVGETDEGAILVSEYIDGLTLRQAHRQGLLTDRDVAEIGAELCGGLHHAHERGVVHGDIKPENVIVRTREENPDQRSGRCQAKLRDFATREILAADPPAAAEPSAYLTPEQIEGSDPEPPSDVFGVALVLFECWTGTNPLAGTTGLRVARIRSRHVPALAELRPDLPAQLAEAIDAALDPEPPARPRALDLRDRLDHVFDDLDFELAVPEPVAPPKPALTLRAAAAAALTPLAACALALAGAAPAAFALASWPAGAARRGLLAAITTLAVLVLAATFDATAAPIALADDATGLGALLTPYGALLIILWSAAAVSLGVLARAPSPVSGLALGTAFTLAALVVTELLSRASAAESLAPLAPPALVAALAAAVAISISRQAARAVGSPPAGEEPLESAAAEADLAPLMPPEPEGAELTVRAGNPGDRTPDPFRLARVP